VASATLRLAWGRWLVGALLATTPVRIAPAQDKAAAVTGADVRFVQGMIAHHRQALEMTALLSGRTVRESLHLLGERITVSQRDEIAMMDAWLRRYATPADSAASRLAHAHHAPPAPDSLATPAMPGMLSTEAMAQLAAATGDDFDRRFLEGMILHHRGALAMVATLLGARGSARQPQLHQMVIDIDADQRAEIARMERLLASLAPTPARR
jgi:uncharacterized protein (DUF305 family)